MPKYSFRTKPDPIRIINENPGKDAILISNGVRCYLLLNTKGADTSLLGEPSWRSFDIIHQTWMVDGKATALFVVTNNENIHLPDGWRLFFGMKSGDACKLYLQRFRALVNAKPKTTVEVID